VIYWSDGKIRIPVGFRLWIPEEKTTAYKTKVDLAYELLTHNEMFCKSCRYVVFDAWYCTMKVLWLTSLMGLPCVSLLKTNRKVFFKGREISVRDVRARLCKVKISGFGKVLVYRDTSGKKAKYLMSTDTLLSGKEVKKRYASRWRGPACGREEIFRFMKQNLGLENCQCRKKTAVRNHVSLVLLGHYAMEVLSARMKLSAYGVSEGLVLAFWGHDRKIPALKVRRKFMKHAA